MIYNEGKSKKARIIGRGGTAEVFELDNNRILKLYHPIEDLDYCCFNEISICKTIQNLGIKSPDPLELISLYGRLGLVFKHNKGYTLDKIIFRQLWKIKKWGKKLGGLHANIHSFESKLLVAQHDILKSMIKDLSIPMINISAMIKHIETLPSGNTVCHGDFNPKNIIYADKEWKVIDWAQSYSGNPFSDVAKTYLILMSPRMETKNLVLNSVIKKMKKVLCQAYLEEYFQLTNSSFKDIEPWLAPVAVVLLGGKVEGERDWLIEFISKQ